MKKSTYFNNAIKNVKYILILGCLTLSPKLFSQELPIIKGPQEELTPSPSAANLGRYGGIDVKKSTGGIAKEIQLFQLQQGAIKYNPSIEYFSTGIRVNDWGGRVGMGWSENFTATIQREVRSVPDEKATQRLSTSVSYLVENRTSANREIVSSLESDANTINGDPTFDGEYDIFSYNLFGVSGQFIIKNNQAVLLTHRDKIKIEILTTSPTYTFRITDVNGFKYLFQTEIEYSSMGVDGYVTPEIATAWYINKIESPFNDELIFNYADIIYTCKTNFSQVYSYKNGLESGEDNIGGESDPLYRMSTNSYNVSRRHTTTKYLTSVTGSEFRLAFDYFSRYDLVGDKMLNMITLYDKSNNPIQRATFTYDTYTSTTQLQGVLAEGDDLYPWNNYGNLSIRYFLNNVSVSTISDPSADSKTYAFTYTTPQNLPHRLSFSQDEGGYYNGISNTWFIPRARVEAYIAQHSTLWNFPMSYTGYRQPTLSATSGILNKITYPTGGSDEIEYELNTYTSNGEEVALPGLRVKRIISSSISSPATIKTYDYKNFIRNNVTNTTLDYTPTTSSHFLMVDNPFVRRFFAIVHFANSAGGHGLDCISGYYNLCYTNFSSNSRFDLNVFHGNPIAYSHVTEYQNSAFIASIYDVSTDLPGSLLYGDEIFKNPKENTAWNNGLELFRYYGTTSDEYGLIDDNNILKEMSWVYDNTDSVLVENCYVFKRYEVSGYYGTETNFYQPYSIVSYNLWSNWVKLASFTEKDYNLCDSGKTITSTKNNYYDNSTHGLLTREETTDSRGNALKKCIRYPADINTGVYSSMVGLNMQNYPVEQTSYVNNYVSGSTLTQFKAGGGSFVPDKTYSLETSSPLSSFTAFNGTTKDSHYSNIAELEYVNYNSNGKIIEYKTRDNITVSFFYLSTYSSNPIIKAFNISYSNLNNALNTITLPGNGLTLSQSYISSGTITSSDIKNIMTGIKNMYPTNLSQVFGYTYKSLLGVTSETDSNGITQFYEYDNFGRLKVVRDNDGNVLKTYNYNYK